MRSMFFKFFKDKTYIDLLPLLGVFELSLILRIFQKLFETKDNQEAMQTICID